jgi:dolichyl-phosphate-mannose-protein mannosyltransferase
MSDDADPSGLRSSWLDRLSALPSGVLVTAAAALFLALSVPALLGDSDTGDESMHLWAAYRQVAAGDFATGAWHPPVAKYLMAAPMLMLGARPPANVERYGFLTPWSEGYAFLHRAGNSAAAVLWWPRVTVLLWGLLIVMSCYALSRRMFGRAGALVTLALVTCCPTLLAHAHLATTDVPGTAVFVLSVLCLTHLLEEPGAFRAAVFGVVLGVALGTKHNLILLIPVSIVLALAASLLAPLDAGAGLGWRRFARRFAPLASLAVAALAAYTTLWAVYQLRFAPSHDPSVRLTWAPPTPDLLGTSIAFARAHRLLPEAYLWGIVRLDSFMRAGHPAYAIGRYSSTGWLWYYPLAFLVKTPVPTLALFAWGLVATVRSLVAPGASRKRATVDKLCVLVPVAAYWWVTVNSSLDAGVRYLLPVLPLLAVLAGAVTTHPGAAAALRNRTIVAVLLVMTAGGVASSAPYYLAYFNLPSTALFDRHFLLVDSNLDWGQDLGRLKRYMDEHHIDSVKLAYFGNASPRELGLRHERLPAFNLYGFYEPEWKPARSVDPGDWLAISATCYVGDFAADRRYYLDRLGQLSPVTTIGHSILLFHIPGPDDR